MSRTSYRVFFQILICLFIVPVFALAKDAHLTRLREKPELHHSVKAQNKKQIRKQNRKQNRKIKRARKKAQRAQMNQNFLTQATQPSPRAPMLLGGSFALIKPSHLSVEAALSFETFTSWGKATMSTFEDHFDILENKVYKIQFQITASTALASIPLSWNLYLVGPNHIRTLLYTLPAVSGYPAMGMYVVSSKNSGQLVLANGASSCVTIANGSIMMTQVQ